MELSRLMSFAERFQESILTSGIIEELETFYNFGIEDIEIELGSKETTDKTNSYNKIKNKLIKNIDHTSYIPIDAYEEHIALKLGFENCIYPGFALHFSSYVDTPGASEAFTHIKSMRAFSEKTLMIKNLCNELGVQPHSLAKDTGEFAIHFPYSDVTGIKQVRSELEAIQRGLTALSESVGVGTQEPEVSIIEEGSLTAVFTVSAAVAGTLYIVIKRSLELVEKFLDIKIKAEQLKKLRMELEKMEGSQVYEAKESVEKLESKVQEMVFEYIDVNNEEFIPIEEQISKVREIYLKKLEKDGIDSILHDIEQSGIHNIDSGRKNELRISSRRFSKWMMSHLTAGASVSSKQMSQDTSTSNILMSEKIYYVAKTETKKLVSPNDES
ncbi:MAG: hypothetical protein ACI86C_001942 [Candidatus Latescibacterota bacterium]|jgi:hypothetical protein